VALLDVPQPSQDQLSAGQRRQLLGIHSPIIRARPVKPEPCPSCVCAYQSPSIPARQAQRVVTSARPVPSPRFVPVAVFSTEPSVAAVCDEIHAASFRHADAGADRRRLAAMARTPPAGARHGPAARLRVSEHVDLMGSPGGFAPLGRQSRSSGEGGAVPPTRSLAGPHEPRSVRAARSHSSLARLHDALFSGSSDGTAGGVLPG
jgi:hypothetical protein